MTPDPKDPLARALELVDELDNLGHTAAEARLCTDLRAAIRAMGEEKPSEDCPACSGRGKVQRLAFASDARIERSCSICRGSGRLPVARPEKHSWVPLAECGELKDGYYFCQWRGDERASTYDGKTWCKGGKFYNPVTHVLNPSLGPIPEANRG